MSITAAYTLGKALLGAVLPRRLPRAGDGPREKDALDPQATAKIIPMAPRSDSGAMFDHHEATQDASSDGGLARPGRDRPFFGDPLIGAFLNEDHRGQGRSDWHTYRSVEARDAGLAHLVVRFDNVLYEAISRRQALIHQFEGGKVSIGDGDGVTASQFRLSQSAVERDIARLLEQVSLAAQGKGWLLAPLNAYRLGFAQGIRQAFDFNELSGG